MSEDKKISSVVIWAGVLLIVLIAAAGIFHAVKHLL